MTDTRRSVRLAACIRVRLTVRQDTVVEGRTASIGRQGALVLSPIRFAKGTLLSIHNALTSQTARGCVVWLGIEEPAGIHRVGIEFIDDVPTFWGCEYEERLALTLTRETVE